jgi:hypothetical protein
MSEIDQGGSAKSAKSANPGTILRERASAAARAELRGDRESILGAIGIASAAPLMRARNVPDRWSFLFVMERMEEGFRILSRLALPTRPRGYINSMPIYLYDQGDLNSQLETYELERLTRMRNRVRILPSPAEIARIRELRRRMDESRKLHARRHADNTAALRELAAKLDRHAATVAAIRPAVAALEMSRSKLATWASIGFAAVVVLGWIVEGGVKWTIAWALSHFQ